MNDARPSTDWSGLGAIALVGPLPPPAGGMANQTRQLSELLRYAAVEVRLVQTNAAYRPRWVAHVPVLRAVFRLAPYLWSLWSVIGQCQVVHLMANSGWAWHLFATPAIWVARLRGVPVLVNYRGGEAAHFLASSSRAVRFTMCRAAALIVPSAFLQEVFARFDMAATVVPNIIDLARFRPHDGHHGGPIHLVVARNLEAVYDNATALRAFKIVSDRYPMARLTIAGTGPEEPRLRHLAADLGLADAVAFAGRLDPDAMATLYRSAHVVLNPSLADNMPNSVLEALASGVPVVSTHVGGVPYMVQDRVTAMLVPPSNASAMAAACVEILANEALRQHLAASGLAEVQRYTWDRVAPLLASAYRRAIMQARH
jgi:glycosyltransferase involved in cell wall biosynthesis